mgnify:CR=1 FL=1
MNKQELITTALVFLIVFGVAFGFISWLKVQNATLYDFKIISQTPTVDALRQVFHQNRSLILKEELTAEASRQNSAVASMGAELVYASTAMKVPVYVYAAVNGIPVNTTCSINNSQCGAPDIVVRLETSSNPCNCIILNANKTMEISGSIDFFLQNAPNIRKVVYLAASPLETQISVNKSE